MVSLLPFWGLKVLVVKRQRATLTLVCLQGLNSNENFVSSGEQWIIFSVAFNICRQEWEKKTLINHSALVRAHCDPGAR